MHHLVNGVCDVCGHVGCDHKTLHEKIVDLYEMGLCPGILYYETCDCGTVMRVDPESIFYELRCDMSDFSEEEDDHSLHMGGTCPKCGLVFNYEAELTETGCVESQYGTFTLRKGETALLDHATWEESRAYHGDEVREEIQLSGTCGGTLVVKKCRDCGEILEKMALKPACPVDFNSNAAKTERVDEDGTKYTVISVSCPDCGLTKLSESWTKTNGCIRTEGTRLEIRCGETVFFSSEESFEADDHDYQEDAYTPLGEDCETDGCRVDCVCENCGDQFYYYTEGHTYAYVDIKLADHGGCETVFSVRRCLACGKVEHFDPSDATMDCQIEQDEVTQDVDGVEHTISTLTCSDCGLRLVTDVWKTQSACMVKENVLYSLSYGDELLLTYQRSKVKSQKHDWDYENAVYEKDNSRGPCEYIWYTVTYTCKICGEKKEDREGGHVWKDYTVDFSGQNGCEGIVEGDQCRFCGTISIDYWEIPCLSNDTVVWDETPVVSTDADGFQHRITNGVCSECGLKFVQDQWEEKESDCVYRDCETMSVYRDETKIFENRMDGSWGDHHDTEVIYDIEGSDCGNVDWYYVSEICKNCGFTRINSGWGHRMEGVIIDGSEYGFCEGTVFRKQICKVCGKVESSGVESHCQFVEDPEDPTLAVCSVCGAKKQRKETRKDTGNCRWEITSATVYLDKDGKECFREESTWAEVTHDYEVVYQMSGNSCKDGVVIVKTCKKCGDRNESDKLFNHNYIQDAVLKEADGICPVHQNEVTVEYCPCEFYLNIWYGSKLEWQSDEDDDTDTYFCADCHLKITRKKAVRELDGCTATLTQQIRMTVGDQVLYSRDFETTVQCHDFVNLQRTETNGVVTVSTTCSKCGKKSGTEFRFGTQSEDDGYYEVIFTPEISGPYIIGKLNYDSLIVYVLEDGSRSEIVRGVGQVYEELTAGKTYVFRWNPMDNSAENTLLYLSPNNVKNCEHSTRSTGVLLPGSKNCEDGCVGLSHCRYCDYCYIRAEVLTSHRGYYQEIDLGQYGVCDRTKYIFEECACGKDVREELEIVSGKCVISDETVDSELFGGCRKHVVTCTECGLSYEVYFTEEKNDNGVVLRTNCKKLILKVGDKILLSRTFAEE